MTTPFHSTESPYPLLTEWFYGRLKGVWLDVKDVIEDDPKLSPVRAGELAAAKLAVQLSQEYVRLEQDVKQRVREHFSTEYSDAYIEFYDRLQDDDLPSYRQILQDISGTRTMLLDEQQYREG